MIDMHIHVVPPNLNGVGPLSPALRGSVENVGRIVREQMQAGGFRHAFAMGSVSDSLEDPLGIDRTLQIARFVPGLRPIGIANPMISDASYLRQVEAQIQQGHVIALKGYLGYLHYYPFDPGYRPSYELAERYHLPFIFHTGYNFSPYAKLKYAQPIHVDEVAVDFPKVKFVMAHVGNPWMIEAAEVVYKNMNVWTDLSGLWVGDEIDLEAEETRDALQDVIHRIRVAFRYAERPNRFLYGSDWPLAPMPAYRSFIEQAIPTEHHELVFAENSQRLFGVE